ncbi:MAG: FUSC family protein [Candidatus Nanopelagicales bacterium]|nr:FUSC family protein [Candidatus Nanopelagicales bacterium]MDZ4249659.1 FUSC family protein [Candidatus Nanopelagicales bacterium]
MASRAQALKARLLRFDRDAIHPGLALTRSTPVALCFLAGLVMGDLASASTPAFGALLIGMLDERDAYRHRVQTMLMGLGVMTPVVLVAGIVSFSVGWHVAAAAVVALGCGLSTAWGPRFGHAAAIALAVFAAFAAAPESVASAVWAAAAFALGGAFQLAVTLSAWLLRRPGQAFSPVGDAWRMIGRAAMPEGPSLLSPSLTEATSSALRRAEDLPPGAPGRDDLLALAIDANIVRRTLTVSNPKRSTPTDSHGTSERASATSRTPLPTAYVTAAATACLLIGRAVSMRRQVKAATDAVASVLASPSVEPRVRPDRSKIDRALDDAIASLVALHRPSAQATLRSYSASGALVTRPLALGMASPVVRQAIPLSITFTLATLLGMAISPDLGYWIAFTVALITQPGYSATIYKTMSRVAGTMLGLVVTALVLDLAPTPAFSILILWAASVGIYLFMPANYGVAVVFITVFAVLTIEILIGPGDRPVLFRAVDTLIGGALVIVAAMIAPQRSAPNLAPKLAALADSVRSSLILIRDGAPEGDLTVVVAASNKLRYEAAAQLDQVWAEPSGHGLHPQVGQRVLRELNNVSLYGADLADGVADTASPELDAALAAFANVSDRLHSVSATGVVPARSPVQQATKAKGPATTPLAAIEDALDSGMSTLPRSI